jgi:1-acyl-sn-glycerol-3-phosphate acyltransferase
VVRFSQALVILLLRPVFYLLFRPRVQGPGLDVQRRTGPLLLVANHSSYVDAFLLALLPFPVLRQAVPVYYPTTSLFMSRWYYRWLLVPVGAYTMHRWHSSLEQYLDQTLTHLQAGNTVLLFPEGGLVRNAERLPGKPGVGLLCERVKDLNLVPIHIEFTRSGRYPLPRLTLTVGEQITQRPTESSMEAYREFADRLLDVIYDL